MCHCLACQRRTGSAFGMQARFPRNRVRIEGRSTEYVRISDHGEERSFHFCPDCGATVYYSSDAELIAVPIGAFADPSFRHRGSRSTSRGAIRGSAFPPQNARTIDSKTRRAARAMRVKLSCPNWLERLAKESARPKASHLVARKPSYAKTHSREETRKERPRGRSSSRA